MKRKITFVTDLTKTSSVILRERLTSSRIARGAILSPLGIVQSYNICSAASQRVPALVDKGQAAGQLSADARTAS